MKIAFRPSPPQTSQVKEPFRKLLGAMRQEVGDSLQKGQTRKAAGLPGVRSIGLAPTTGQVLGDARARVNSEANRLEHVRTEHTAFAVNQIVVRNDDVEAGSAHAETRIVDLILTEFDAPFFQDAAPKQSPAVETKSSGIRAAHQDASGSASREAQAAEVLALIEHIESLLRSSRPALVLTLNNSLGAKVEIERVGAGAIALTLVGDKGPPTAEIVGLVRSELKARGLTVAALSVG